METDNGRQTTEDGQVTRCTGILDTGCSIFTKGRRQKTEGQAKISEYNINIKFKIPDQLDNLIVMLVLLYRRIRYGYTFRRIRLTQGRFAIVDVEDYDRLAGYKWHCARHGNRSYAFRRQRGKKTKIAMHRQIVNAPGDLFVDHIDGNGLNNRRSNLRLCKAQQNAWNRRPLRGGSSKYKGVTWKEQCQKWFVRICYKGGYVNIGHFEDEIEAAKAYDKKAKELFGEFAYLNFPKDI